MDVGFGGNSGGQAINSSTPNTIQNSFDIGFSSHQVGLKKHFIVFFTILQFLNEISITIM
jgi:hypothetical protein